ncbi:MAG TPA: TRAP transporter substrate-binding protein [Thermodesulfobacteriota bacterium]
MSRSIALAAALAAALVAAPPAAVQAAAPTERIVLKFGHITPPGSLHDLAAQEFARRVNAQLEGRVEVRVYGNSALGTDEEMVKGIRTGAVDMFLPGGVMSTVDPIFGIFELPYLIDDRDHMRRATENRAVQHALYPKALAKGMRILGIWEHGFKQVTNNTRPIVRPADLRDLKIRVPSAVWRLRTFQAFGASPAAAPWKDVYDLLKTGRMDGQEAALTLFMSAGIQHVQKYLSLTDHVYTPAYLVINEDVYRKLPKDARRVLTRVGYEMAEWSRKEGARLDRELMARLPPTIEVNEVDKDAFFRASIPLYEQFASEVPGGTILIKTIQGLRR